MKWFMSYVKTYSRDRACCFGFEVYADDEHPIARVKTYNEMNAKDGQQTVLLSFQQVGDDQPDADEMTTAWQI